MEFYAKISATNKGGNPEHPVAEEIPDYQPSDEVFPASSDVGDVSWVVPTGQVYTNCYAAGTAMHSWQAVAQGKSAIAHKGMMAAAKVMAMTGAQLLLNPDLVEKAKADWKEELDGETYPSPLPKDSRPEIW